MNSWGGVIRIDESENDKMTLTQQRDEWMQELEGRLNVIIPRGEYKKCIHYPKAPKFPYYFLFVKRCEFVCTQSNGLKVSLNCCVVDAKYDDILNILNNRVTSDQPGSSSLEMSEEDLEHDSGYTDDTSLVNNNDELFYKRNVRFSESNTVQFKQGGDTLAKLLTCIERHLKNYVSAFANGNGGKVYFGIDNNGMVTGQVFRGEEQKMQVKKLVETIMTRKGEDQITMIRIWGNPGFVPKYGEQWSVDFVEAIGSPEGSERCVVVVEIFPCEGGMFLTRPLAWEVDESSEKVVEIEFEEWKSRHASHPGTVHVFCNSICFINFEMESYLYCCKTIFVQTE